MKFKFNALVAALALIASAGAHATVQTAANPGNSTVFFVATSSDNSVSLTVDLGTNLADFLQLAPAGYTFGATAGALSAKGTIATWTFGTNAYVLNQGAAVTAGNGWSDAFSSFVSQAGSTYKWGVVAADNVSPATVSATNTISRLNLFSTGNPTQAEVTAVNASAITNGAATGVFGNWVNATAAAGNHASVVNGANVSTDGNAKLYTLMKDKFGTNLAWSYLSDVGTTANVFLSHSNNSAATVFQLGSSYGVDTLLSNAADAATFTFDGTTLTYQVAAVPEASTIAMMLAGLGAVGFMTRRRKAA